MSERFPVTGRNTAVKTFIDHLLDNGWITSLTSIKRVSVKDLTEEILPSSLSELADVYDFIITLDTTQGKTFKAVKIKEGKDVHPMTLDLLAEPADFQIACSNAKLEEFELKFSGEGKVRSIQLLLGLVTNEKALNGWTRSSKEEVKEIFIID